MKRRALLLAALPFEARAAMNFPRDFGAHTEERIEWWYLTGILDGADGKPRFGYQLTFFRLRGPAPADHTSPFAARQLLLGHAALSDLQAGRQLQDQRVARTGLGLNEASERDCDVRMERGWSLRRTGAGYVAHMEAQGFTLELDLKATQPVLLQGREGLSQKGPDQSSRYYSQPQLQTTARLKLANASHQLTGRSWLDHEWSSDLLGPGAVGWDWTGLNLDEGAALTLFRLRRADGTVLWRGGSWREAGGVVTELQLDMQPQRRWKSPASGAEYPLEWLLPNTPRGTLRLRPLMDAQEIDARASAGMRYWEGAVELVEVQKNSRLGAGYLELTGYASPMKLPV